MSNPSYHPSMSYKTEETEKHTMDLVDFINDIPLKNEIIIGADTSAAMEVRGM